MFSSWCVLGGTHRGSRRWPHYVVDPTATLKPHHPRRHCPLSVLENLYRATGLAFPPSRVRTASAFWALCSRPLDGDLSVGARVRGEMLRRGRSIPAGGAVWRSAKETLHE